MGEGRRFALKIALCNTIGFCATVGFVTYIDPLITTLRYPLPRSYPAGPWIVGLGGLLLFTSTLSLFRTGRTAVMAFGPSILLLVIGFVSLFFFRPEFPHASIVVWLPLYAVVSGLVCWLHFSPVCKPDPEVSRDLRLERLKEAAALWRTIAISALLAYTALLFPAVKLVWDLAQEQVRPDDKESKLTMAAADTVLLALFSAYVAIGIIFELFDRAARTADVMLTLGPSPPKP